MPVAMEFAKTAAKSAKNHSGELKPKMPTLLRGSRPKEMNAFATVRTSEIRVDIPLAKLSPSTSQIAICVFKDCGKAVKCADRFEWFAYFTSKMIEALQLLRALQRALQFSGHHR